MEIDKVLQQAPAKIAELAQLHEESRFCWKSSEIRLKQMEAQVYLKFKAEDTEAKIGDLKVLVENDTSIYEQRMACISHESESRKALIEVDKWGNAFTASRKMASLKIEEMRSLHDTVGSKNR